jgi:pimeloyl-ACP methyl ester carboxylesterase
MPAPLVRESRVVHGHKRAFVRAGSGPVLLLLHGIGNNCQTWAGVIDRLAESHTVIAPDLLGHGASDKPRADYSIAAYANGMRDLLSVLDIEQATVVGHSLGGGIALQFAYQFPERCQRLALVGSGGLGPELSAGLRAATLPGAELVLTALTGVSGPLRAGMQVLERVGRLSGWKRMHDLAEAGDALLALKDVEARRAFLRTLRGVVDAHGQAVTAIDRLYLANSIPMLVVWGSRDPIVPAAHADTVRRLVPSARVEVFEGSGHWPHLDDPDRFCDVLLDFVATTEPASHDLDSWRRLLSRDGPAAGR